MARRLPFPHVLLFVAPLIWATSNVTAKWSVGLLTPFQFTFYRWFLACVILSFVFRREIAADFKVLRGRALWLFIWGGSAFCGFNLLLYQAFNLGVRVVDVAIVHSLIPLLVFLGGFFIYRQRSHFLQWLGVLVAFFGVLWLLSAGDLRVLLSLQLGSGMALVLLTALIYAGYSLELRRSPEVHWASLLWAMCVAACFVALPFFIYEFWGSNLWLARADLSFSQGLKALALVFYVSVFVAILSKVFYMEGVIAVGAERGAMVMNLLPVLNALMGLLFFSDERASFSSVHVVSLFLVCLGIVLSEYGARFLRCV